MSAQSVTECAHVLKKSQKMPEKKLSELLLECWQRESCDRPYEDLVIVRKIFVRKMLREFNANDFKIILEFLQKKKIKRLGLLYVDIVANYPNLKIFAKELKNVSSVSLVNVKLSPYVLKIMADDASDYKIKCLSLRGNPLCKDHVQHLREFLIHNHTIEALDIALCSLNEASFAIIADGVYHSERMHTIDMSNIQPMKKYAIVDDIQIATIISNLIWHGKLVEVHFRHCSLDSHGVEPIAEYIEEKNPLEYLDISCNKIGCDGIAYILKGCERSTKLRRLDVSRNPLGDKGGENIAHLLPKTSIKYLDICRCSIGAKFMRLLLLTIKKPKYIRALNISGNRFDGECALVLRRLIMAGVLLKDSIDVDVTYDEHIGEYRVVPQENLYFSYKGQVKSQIFV